MNPNGDYWSIKNTYDKPVVNVVDPTEYVTDETGKYPKVNDGNEKGKDILNPKTEVDLNAPNNPPNRIEYEEGFLSKWGDQVEDKDGEFNMHLQVEGKGTNMKSNVDVVFVLDNSGSMAVPYYGESGGSRPKITELHEQTQRLINDIFEKDSDARIGIINYATWVDKRYYDSNVEAKVDLRGVSAKDYLLSQVPNSARGSVGDTGTNTFHEKIGLTNTQEALREAARMLQRIEGNGRARYIVLLTDGAPTVSQKLKKYPITSLDDFSTGLNIFSHIANGLYNLDNKANDGEDLQYSVPGYGTVMNHGVALRTETDYRKRQLPDVTYMAVAIDNIQTIDNATREDRVDLFKYIVSDPNKDFYEANQSGELKDRLDLLFSGRISIQDGTVTDPMGEMAILNGDTHEGFNGGWYHITASDGSTMGNGLLKNARVISENNTIKITGLDLGEKEWVKLDYKINLDTKHPEYKGAYYYEANKRTTLQPKSDPNYVDENTKEPIIRDFPIPSIKGPGIVVEKIWKYKNDDPIANEILKEKGITSVTFDLYEEGKETPIKTGIELTLEKNWREVLPDIPPYDSLGNPIKYTAKEISINGVSIDGYEINYSYDTDKLTLTIENKEKTPPVEFPKTGGIGTIPFMLLGSVFMLIALIKFRKRTLEE